MMLAATAWAHRGWMRLQARASGCQRALSAGVYSAPTGKLLRLARSFVVRQPVHVGSLALGDPDPGCSWPPHQAGLFCPSCFSFFVFGTSCSKARRNMTRHAFPRLQYLTHRTKRHCHESAPTNHPRDYHYYLYSGATIVVQ